MDTFWGELQARNDDDAFTCDPNSCMVGTKEEEGLLVIYFKARERCYKAIPPLD